MLGNSEQRRCRFHQETSILKDSGAVHTSGAGFYVNSSWALFCVPERAKSLTFLSAVLESSDREIDTEDIQGATSEDFLGRPADVTRMNQQLFNVLAQKTRGNPFQTVKNMSEEEGCCGAGVWVKLLRAYNGKNPSRSQRLTERVHDIKRVVVLKSTCSRGSVGGRVEGTRHGQWL